jgi:hypothetical protein
MAALNLQQVGQNPVAQTSKLSGSQGTDQEYAGSDASPIASTSQALTRRPPPLPARTSSSSSAVTSQVRPKPPSLPPRTPSGQAASQLQSHATQPAIRSSSISRAADPLPTKITSPRLAVGLSGMPLTFSGVQINKHTTQSPCQTIRSVPISNAANRVGPTTGDMRPPLPPSRSTPNAIPPPAAPPVPTRPPVPPRIKQVEPETTLSSSKPRKSALDFGFDNKPVTAQPQATVAAQQTTDDSLIGGIAGKFTPMLNLALKPRLTQMVAPAQPQYSLPIDPNGQDCLLCRDFSGPDQHATRYPRQTVRSLEQLGHDLTAPFSNLTDKARAICTWMHHNIAYNYVDFLAGNIKPSTPSSTLQTGLAVCEGYAALYTNLALHAGLQCITSGGHGKGLGYAALRPGDSLPEFKGNHAWNVIKLEDADGGWKLIDPTWSSGALFPDGKYHAKFTPGWFTMSNAEFGLKHFPTDQTQHFLLRPEHGGPLRPPTWQEYITDQDKATQMGKAEESGFGIGHCVYPRLELLDLGAAAAQGPKMRFELNLRCTHFRLDLRKRYPAMLTYGDGPNAQRQAFIPTANGRSWFTLVDLGDVRRRCKVGDDIICMTVDTYDGGDAAGRSASEIVNNVGKKAMSFTSMVKWKIATL